MVEIGRTVDQPGRGVELIGRESLSSASALPVRAFGFGPTTVESGATETGGEFKLTPCERSSNKESKGKRQFHQESPR